MTDVPPTDAPGTDGATPADGSANEDESPGGSHRLHADGGSAEGLVTVESDASVAESVDRVKAAIQDIDGLGLLAEFDHTANAERVGRDLLATTVLVVGNPDIGTPLMQDDRTVAIDMPQKLLVAEHDDGRVTVSYNDPDYLAARHGISEDHETIQTIGEAVPSLAAVAAGTDD